MEIRRPARIRTRKCCAIQFRLEPRGDGVIGGIVGRGMLAGGIARLRSCTTTFSHVSAEFEIWSASALSRSRPAVLSRSL